MAKNSLIYAQENGGLVFGDFGLTSKAKEEATLGGNAYKVKTYKAITKLERNELFVYESVPGTRVTDFIETEDGMTFAVEGSEDAQIILGLEDNTTYRVFVNDVEIGDDSTGVGGKLNLSLELAGEGAVKVKVVK